MLEIREMTAADLDTVMPMVREFYRSPAVEHDVDPAILERAFRDAADEAVPALRGLLLLDDGAPAGYCYLTGYYSCEVGGMCLMVEELYFTPEHRGRGYGTQVFQYVMEQYPEYRRFRLEVTQANQGAVRLYKKLGFRFLEYGQMVLDREEA